MLRKMLAGKDARDHANILEHGFGKVVQDVNLRTWRDDVIDLLRSGDVTAAQVKVELGDELAAELIAAAGVPGGTGGEDLTPGAKDQP